MQVVVRVWRHAQGEGEAPVRGCRLIMGCCGHSHAACLMRVSVEAGLFKVGVHGWMVYFVGQCQRFFTSPFLETSLSLRFFSVLSLHHCGIRTVHSFLLSHSLYSTLQSYLLLVTRTRQDESLDLFVNYLVAAGRHRSRSGGI